MAEWTSNTPCARPGRLSPAESLATKADLADLRAATPEPENFAARSEVAVLQNEMTDVKAAIVRIDKTLVHMDKRIDVVEEKISGIRTLLFAIYTPLLLLILASQFGILTRGILWAVAP